ncbi:MAG TPA: hypothetical protein ENG87_05970 [Candidatus Pacearchaeota archaeon]|nr:hypothetical protein [Candidatus Pacearchaeota archaeon]
MLSPTGKGIRHDKEGNGEYGAKRGKRLHQGTDYICTPNQMIVSPISGTVIRKARPYANDKYYSGIVIQGKHIRVKMFYLKPLDEIIGKTVKAGDYIGVAQDISLRYNSKMIPHIHLRIVSFNPEILIDLTS